MSIRVGDYIVSSLPQKPDDSYIDIDEIYAPGKDGTVLVSDYPELAAAKPGWVTGGTKIKIPDFRDKHMRIAGAHGAQDTLLNFAMYNRLTGGYAIYSTHFNSGDEIFSFYLTGGSISYNTSGGPQNNKEWAIGFHPSRVMATADELRSSGFMLKIYLRAKSRSSDEIKHLLDIIYPVGSVITLAMSPTEQDGANTPEKIFGYGTWELFSTGKMLIGTNPEDPDFQAVGMTGGNKIHSISIDELPEHSHGMQINQTRWPMSKEKMTSAGNEVTNTSLVDAITLPVGKNKPINIMNPYMVVAFWKRTA